MGDGGKFVNLMEGCTRQEARSKKIEVQHRVKGTSLWNEGGKKNKNTFLQPSNHQRGEPEPL